MRTHALPITLGAATALAVGLLAPATAQAAPSVSIPKTTGNADRSAVQGACSITEIGPKQITVGVKPQTVQFAVGTDCDSQDPSIEWSVQGRLYPGSAHVGWFGACTYSYEGPAVYVCPDGRITLDLVGSGTFKGNQMAGEQKIYAYAFDDLDRDNRDDDAGAGRDRETSTFDLLRHTRWASFDASPEPRRKGQKLWISGKLKLANWDTGTYETYSPAVELQFKADGRKSYHTIAEVDGTKTKVVAKRSGRYRFSYPGDETHAASTSASDHVKVRSRHHHR